MRANSILLFFICLSLFSYDAIFGQTTLNEKADLSLRKIFGDSISVITTVIQLSPDEKAKITQRSRNIVMNDTAIVYICTTHGKVGGYGFVDDVKGKDRLITYLVAVNPTGSVKDIDVLVYRESYGGEIAYESFRKQFRKKTAQDKLKPGKDIKNISGATISVHAITNGVRKILSMFEIIQPRLQQLYEQ